MIQPRPGDAVLIGRKLTVRSWLTKPIRTALSWRIQAAGCSKWNHVAACIGPGKLAEAEWDCGIQVRKVSDYDPAAWHLAIAQAPDEIDCDRAIQFWRARLMTQRYDARALLLMRMAGVLYGLEGIRERIQHSSNDDAWICSEWVAAGWEHGGMALATKTLISPWDFDEYIVS
jgi:hypothetical protein